MDKWNRVPLYYAATLESSEIVTVLIKQMQKIDNFANWYFFKKAAKKAVKSGKKANYLLLEDYLDFDYIRNKLLPSAVDCNHAELFIHILREDPDFKQYFDHYKIYKHVITIGNYDMCKYLIEAGFNIHATDRYNNTPLHYSAENGRGDIFDLLVKQGANPNALNNESKTPNL